MAVVSKGSDQADFLFEFGHFIILWNHVELAARDILVWLAGGNITATILSQQTGNASLTDAMRVSSPWKPEAKEHLLHFSNLMDTIRPYRNYYVHNLLGVLPEVETGKMIGAILSLNVKGKYTLHEKALKSEDLIEMSGYADKTRIYGLAILEIFKDNEDLKTRIELFSLLEKPALPKTLAKTARDPQSS